MIKKLQFLVLLLILVFLAKSGYAMDVGNLNSKGNVTVKGSVQTDTLQNATGGDTVIIVQLSDATLKRHTRGHSLGSASDHIDVDTNGLSDGQALKFFSSSILFASGGTEVDTGIYTIHTFTASDTIIFYGIGNAEILVVGGGGGGGGGEYHGAGGGGGGVQYDASFAVTAQAYGVTVGNGGAGGIGGGAASNGSNSVFSTITATGGGCGANQYNAAGNGGCGGGASITSTAGTGSQGYDGGLGYGAPSYGRGGGGGAGSVGGAATDSAGGNGGAGYTSTISGSSKNYAGGGGGGCFNGTVGTGTDGGGNGAGYYNSPYTATSGTVNTGGGGGGAERDGGAVGGAGGSGIIIIKCLKYLSATNKWVPVTIPTQGQMTLWDATGADSHIHTNKAVLDAIDVALTTALKATYDAKVDSDSAAYVDAIGKKHVAATGTSPIVVTGQDISLSDTDFVHGPASSTDNYVAIFSGTTGKLLKQSTLFDTGTTGNFDVAGRISAGNVTSPTKTVEIKLSDSAGADSVVIRNSAGTIIATIGSNGNITATGNPVINATDIYTTAWTDYFDTSIKTGWSGYTPTKDKIFYKKIGKIVFVLFCIEGTSDATTASFTLPYTSTTDGTSFPYMIAILKYVDNNAAVTTPGHIELDTNSSTVNCFTNMGSGAWTNSSTKGVYGQFWYQCQ